MKHYKIRPNWKGKFSLHTLQAKWKRFRSNITKSSKASDWTQLAFASISQANSDLISTGRSGGVQMVDIFADGAWLDYRNIPILNTDTSKPIMNNTKISNIIFMQLVAGLVNYTWIQQQTYIISYPMTQNDCKWLTDPIMPITRTQTNLIHSR
jgi:hypothetical protein